MLDAGYAFVILCVCTSAWVSAKLEDVTQKCHCTKLRQQFRLFLHIADVNLYFSHFQKHKEKKALLFIMPARWVFLIFLLNKLHFELKALVEPCALS